MRREAIPCLLAVALAACATFGERSVEMGRDPAGTSPDGTYDIWFRTAGASRFEAPRVSLDIHEDCGRGVDGLLAYLDQATSAEDRMRRRILETQRAALACAEERGLMPPECVHGVHVLAGLGGSDLHRVVWVTIRCVQEQEEIRESELAEGEWIHRRNPS